MTISRREVSEKKGKGRFEKKHRVKIHCSGLPREPRGRRAERDYKLSTLGRTLRREKDTIERNVRVGVQVDEGEDGTCSGNVAEGKREI